MQIRKIIWDLIEFEKEEETYYSQNPELMAFRETQYYNIPADTNKLFPIERVRIPLLEEGEISENLDFRMPIGPELLRSK